MSLEKFCCDRCGNKNPGSLIMSKFNEDMLCPSCKTKEEAHPMYEHACEVELASVRNGNYNFAGIGKPSDL